MIKLPVCLLVGYKILFQILDTTHPPVPFPCGRKEKFRTSVWFVPLCGTNHTENLFFPLSPRFAGGEQL
jgi:hypothetical protein